MFTLEAVTKDVEEMMQAPNTWSNAAKLADAITIMEYMEMHKESGATAATYAHSGATEFYALASKVDKEKLVNFFDGYMETFKTTMPVEYNTMMANLRQLVV